MPGVTGGYTIEVAEEPEGPFTFVAQSPSTKLTIGGRTPMKTYWVRSRAIGTAGPQPVEHGDQHRGHVTRAANSGHPS